MRKFNLNFSSKIIYKFDIGTLIGKGCYQEHHFPSKAADQKWRYHFCLNLYFTIHSLIVHNSRRHNSLHFLAFFCYFITMLFLHVIAITIDKVKINIRKFGSLPTMKYRPRNMFHKIKASSYTCAYAVNKDR
jgi:hypothetical protein